MIDPFKGLGRPRRLDSRVCSLCDDPIPAGHVPLILYASGRSLMWVYCSDCEPIILDSYKQVHGDGNNQT